MEIDSKYYTPKLEEFHIGFEYEIKENNGYRKIIFDGYTPLIEKSFCGDYGDWYDSLEEDIKIGIIRVKYLDKEDVESLGWIKNHLQLDNEFILRDNQNRLWGLVIYKEGNINLINNKGYFTDVNIKNKSELNKLMEQLNITKVITKDGEG